MATIIKPAGMFWTKVVEVGGDVEGGEAKQQPPMAPSAFAALLETLTFTNGSDREVVRDLYLSTMEDGFGGVKVLRYPKMEWGDEEVMQLMASLREVRCAGVLELNLNGNKALKSGQALADIGQLTSLTKLDLSACEGLSSLPDSIGQLTALKRFDLRGCKGLCSLPDSIGQLTALKMLNLGGCEGLSSLPNSIGQLRALTMLMLLGCKGLTLLPDLSSLPQGVVHSEVYQKQK